MSSVSTYLNFDGQTEKAFAFYRQVFGTDYVDGIQKMKDVPASARMRELSEEEKERVMHVALPITGGHMLMGSDILPSQGQSLTVGNNVHINLEVDTRAETESLFTALSEDGQVVMGLEEMFWGDYFGACQDQFGINWFINCSQK